MATTRNVPHTRSVTTPDIDNAARDLATVDGRRRCAIEQTAIYTITRRVLDVLRDARISVNDLRVKVKRLVDGYFTVEFARHDRDGFGEIACVSIDVEVDLDTLTPEWEVTTWHHGRDPDLVTTDAATAVFAAVDRLGHVA